MQQRYSYAGESAVRRDGLGVRVGLSTSGGPVAYPFFFSGFLARPRLSASLLLSVSKVAGTRFYVPSATIDAVIRAADPVVTSDGQRLRFESFSVCTGVYSRADFSADALDDGFVESGTTNVDFNPPMRNALARLRETDAVHLSVGADEVTLSSLRETVTERRVPLPARWLRGFAEVQVVQGVMTPRFELGIAETRRFLSMLERTPKNGDWWVAPSEEGVVLTSEPGPDRVRVGGLKRLRLLTRHARDALALRVWSTDESSCSSAWELELPASRLTLVVSPEPSRGFSGEGNVLSDVADESIVVAAERLRPVVQDSADVDASVLASQVGLDRSTVLRALNVLASSGVVGYDIGSARFFARQLPFDSDAMALLHPRLQGARSLGSAAVVVLERQPDGTAVAAVTGRNATYIVRSTASETSCTCPWFEKHGSSRGPCKHALAVQMFDAEPLP